MWVRTFAFVATLLAVAAANGLAQAGSPSATPPGRIGKHQLSVDIGPLEGGVAYAHRVANRLSVGGRFWAAWEPRNSFEANVFEPMGAELLLRYHPSAATQLELGPSLLRYQWADDCSECTGSFAGLHASAMVGAGVFSLGPTARFGVLSGSPSGSETGFLYGIQVRLLFSLGD